MKSKSVSVDKVKINEKTGKFTVTGTEVTVNTTKGKADKPGTHKVNVERCLDRIVDKEFLFSHIIRKLDYIESVDVPSTSTDGTNIFWNKEFLSSMPEDQQCGVLLHEVLHNAFLHLWRRDKRDPMRWNIACDYAINLVVNKTFPLPPGTLLDTQYTNLSAEEIYDILPVKNIKEQGWCQKESWGDPNGKGNNQQQGKGQGNIFKKIAQGVHDAAIRQKEADARKKAAQKGKSQKESEWSQAFDKAFTKNYGKSPDYIKRLISERHYIPVINWAELVSNILSEDISDYTFSQPDRRFLEADFMLPELYSWDRVKDVIFAYDTSGSISDDDLKAFYKETIVLFEQFPNLTGWSAVCDADVHSFKEITPDTTYKDIHFQGGGGTDFRPVFDEVEKRSLRPKAMFYFTDTYGSFPQKDPGFPVFWLVHSYIGDSNQLNVPWGRIIKFMNKSQLAEGKDPMRRPGGWW